MQKNTLAWAFATSEELSNLKHFVQIKEQKVGKYMQVKAYIGRKILQNLSVKKLPNNVPVKMYKPQSALDTNTYYYIQF